MKSKNLLSLSEPLAKTVNKWSGRVTRSFHNVHIAVLVLKLDDIVCGQHC